MEDAFHCFVIKWAIHCVFCRLFPCKVVHHPERGGKGSKFTWGLPFEAKMVEIDVVSEEGTRGVRGICGYTILEGHARAAIRACAGLWRAFRLEADGE
jgi:hypothetical protein